MPEDMPVLKRINVMVGITRSKVIEGKTVKRMCNGSESSSWPLQKVAIAYHPCQMLAATFAIHGLGTRLQKPLRIESFQRPNSHKHWPCSALWTTSSSVVIDRSSHLPGRDATKAWVGSPQTFTVCTTQYQKKWQSWKILKALKNVHGMVHSEFAKARRTIMPSQKKH